MTKINGGKGTTNNDKILNSRIEVFQLKLINKAILLGEKKKKRG